MSRVEKVAVEPPRRYEAFGLVMRSSLPLLELSAASGHAPVDIEVECGDVPETLPLGRRGVFTVAGDDALMCVPGVARFLLQAGRKVTIAPEPDAPADDVRGFLLTMVFGALLHQRDELVLHGSAVAIGGEAAAFLGFSGRGKSTLAAGFRRRGYPVLTDDLCVVRRQADARWAIQPSFPHMKLWLDSLEKLELSSEGLRRIRHKESKRALPIGGEFATASLPVRTFYLLRPSSRSETVLRPLEGPAKVAAFRNQTYRPGMLAAMGRKARHFHQMLELAQHVGVTVVERPEHGFKLEETMALIEADFTGRQRRSR